MSRPDAHPAPDGTDLRLIDHLHGGLPLSDRPFAEVGMALGMHEDEVLARLQRLLAQGVLTRFGPLYHIERAGGRFVLAALEVPEERFDEVAALVNAMPEVAHNYRREHAFNMWFVTATDSAAAASAVLARIEAQTRLPVHAFPKEREFFVELRLPMQPDDGRDESRP
jgi:DNA-binding Lrp family transcriptional regulator